VARQGRAGPRNNAGVVTTKPGAARLL